MKYTRRALYAICLSGLFFASNAFALKVTADYFDLADKMFATHKDEFKRICSRPAELHCRKSENEALTQTHFRCLYRLNERMTKDLRRGFDGTECDKTISKIRKKMMTEKPRRPYKHPRRGQRDNAAIGGPGCEGGTLSSDGSQIHCPDGSVYQRRNGVADQINRGALVQDEEQLQEVQGEADADQATSSSRDAE